MASESPNEAYGRGMRQIVRSRRAKEADEAVADLQKSSLLSTSDSSLSQKPASAQSASPPVATTHPPELNSLKLPVMACHDEGAEQRDTKRAGPLLPDQPISQVLQSDLMPQQILASIEAQDQDARNSASGDAVPAIPLQPQQPSSQPFIKQEKGTSTFRRNANSVQPPTKSQRVTKPQKSRQRRAPSAAQPRRKRAATPQDNIQRFMTEDELLRPGKLHIYRWDYPIPKDFLNLPEDLKAAKARTDAAEAELDTDPELDDWHEFCGLESDLFPDLPLKSSIGLNFISRAKRAYRAGQSWSNFERDELAIDSRAGARALTDPHEREIALSSSLSNTLRLYVFEQIKVRLCHEIWLQPYPENEEEAHRNDSVIGTVNATPLPSDKTALDLATQH